MCYVYLKALRHGSHSFACLSFVSVYQMAPPLTEVGDIQLRLTTHLSTRRDKRLSWPGWLTYSGRFTQKSFDILALYKSDYYYYYYYHKWSPVSYRSSAGQGKFASQRPTFYHCATKPKIALN